MTLYDVWVQDEARKELQRHPERAVAVDRLFERMGSKLRAANVTREDVVMGSDNWRAFIDAANRGESLF